MLLLLRCCFLPLPLPVPAPVFAWRPQPASDTLQDPLALHWSVRYRLLCFWGLSGSSTAIDTHSVCLLLLPKSSSKLSKSNIALIVCLVFVYKTRKQQPMCNPYVFVTTQIKWAIAASTAQARNLLCWVHCRGAIAECTHV